MWFLIKGAFWFSLVLVLLPIFGTDDAARQPAATAASGVDIGQTVSAATEALGYIGAICLEKPDVCTKGAETFTALGHRAKEGARIAYQMLDTQFGDAGAETTGDPVTTGTVSPDPNDQQALPPLPTPTVDAVAGEPSLAEALGVSRIPVPEKRISPKAS